MTDLERPDAARGLLAVDVAGTGAATTRMPGSAHTGADADRSAPIGGRWSHRCSSMPLRYPPQPCREIGWVLTAKFDEVTDRLRQEYHSRVAEAKLQPRPAKTFSVPNGGLPPRSREFECPERGASVGGPSFEGVAALEATVQGSFYGCEEIFDSSREPISSHTSLRELRSSNGRLGLNIGSFFKTYDRFEDEDPRLF